MGVGGNDSWSNVAAPLEQYQVKSQNYNYRFYLVPFDDKNSGSSLDRGTIDLSFL